MSILSWNCQGAGSKETVRRLSEMCQHHFPDFIFLMETKQKKDYVTRIKQDLRYDNVFTVEPAGLSGGLAFMWNNSHNVEFLSSSSRLLDLKISLSTTTFFLSCVYGDPVRERRQPVWNRLSSIGLLRDEPWMLVGDFNELLSPTEKLGGPERDPAHCLNFKIMTENCNIRDMVHTGNYYSWVGYRDEQWIQSRLDRAFGNEAWFSLFPLSSVAYLDIWASDHRPLVVTFSQINNVRGRGRFTYDSRMGNKPGIDDVVARGWNGVADSSSATVLDRLARCRRELASWKRTNSHNSATCIAALHSSLEHEVIKQQPDRETVKSLKSELSKAYLEEEQFWKAKSRVNWLKEGDRNTRYFHNCVKGRKLRNKIHMLHDSAGSSCFDEDSKGDIAVQYFQDLFTSSNPAELDSILSSLSPRVTGAMNDMLLRPVSLAEIKEAAFSIKGSSSPGPDGFSGRFYSRFWHIVGPSLSSEIQEFFAAGVFPQAWNHTHLCLIPKVASPTRMTDIRPISLCSVHYKIISKILCDRLKVVLPDIVSETQGAFVSGRLISDNILIAHEITHTLRTDTTISSNYLAIKTDMSKAFDRVEWSFLQALLLRLGFADQWVAWIMTCVTTVSFSVLLNGRAFGHIIPQRGLRQGDPLSPFLFILCVEALIAVMAKAESQGLIHGIQFSSSGPSINNLMFADDSLLICKATIDECQELSRCLDLYSVASGQLINFQKSSIIFGSRVDPNVKQAIQMQLNIPQEGGEGTYLGLPECFSGSKRRLMRFIHEKLGRRLNGWFSKSLSHGGKEILMKSIALALPVYAMSCFRLSQDLYEKITSAMIQFWWSSGNNHRKIPWVAWKSLCRDKEKGGLGFHDLADFNQALLCKQAWRILDKPDSLFAKVLKSRYFSCDHFLAAGLGSRPSYAWRSILFGRELLSRGLLRSIGNGRETYALTANWIWDSNTPRPPIPILDSINPYTRVVDFIDRSTSTWMVDRVNACFVPQDAAYILRLRISPTVSDSFVWGLTTHGAYTSKSGYKALQQLKQDELDAQVSPLQSVLWKKIWKLKTAPKLRHFLWRALNGALAVADRLQTRNIQISSLCKCCLSGVETIAHVLFTCPRAHAIWQLSGLPLPPSGFSSTSVLLNIHYLVALLAKHPSSEIALFFPWIIWHIWKQRNELVFENVSWDADHVWSRAKQEAEDFLLAGTATAPCTGSNASGFQRWQPPPSGFLKCNVAGSWVGASKAVGAAWFLRDATGSPLLHGRNSFAPGKSHLETDLLSILWAAESISTLNRSHVVFELTSKQAHEAVLFPSRFPSLRVLTNDILFQLNKIPSWQLVLSSPSSNEVARRLAASVTKDVRPHSYIQTGGPSWLQPQILLDSAFF